MDCFVSPTDFLAKTAREHKVALIPSLRESLCDSWQSIFKNSAESAESTHHNDDSCAKLATIIQIMPILLQFYTPLWI